MIASADIRTGDCREVLRTLPERSVHCCVTSPPYYGLRAYHGGDDMIGLEDSPDAHLAALVETFREVRRVLRDDGTVWVNYGDAYSSGNSGLTKGAGRPGASQDGARQRRMPEAGQSGQLMLMPYRLALALQADGWLVRSVIIWAKGVSFCDTYHGSVMPESLNGWRWERCRVMTKRNATYTEPAAVNCPGCDKCAPNDGYVLRRGSWRPTCAHEVVLMLAKRSGYYCDGEAVREEQSPLTVAKYAERGEQDRGDYGRDSNDHGEQINARMTNNITGGRNPRNVWTINPQPFPDAHFATYPEKLIEPIIKAATSERGVCPECGAPWARVLEKDDIERERPNGWRPTCECSNDPETAPAAAPATVLDPFAGSGTTALVSRKLGRSSIGIELSEEYTDMARRRVGDYAPLFNE
jgi:DNA modification methylase